MSVAAAFDAVAGEYDAARRRLGPVFRCILPFRPELVAEWGSNTRNPRPRPWRRTGLLAAIVRARPSGLPPYAGRRRSGVLDQASTITRRPPSSWWPTMACLGGPGTTAVSASTTSIAHGHKQPPFGCIHTALAPGGLFVNAYQVLGHAELEARAYARWRDQAAALG